LFQLSHAAVIDRVEKVNKKRGYMRIASLVIIGSCAMFYCTGCAGVAQRATGFTLVTDAAGLDAWHRGQVGLVTEGKNPRDKKSAFWDNQDMLAGEKFDFIPDVEVK